MNITMDSVRQLLLFAPPFILSLSFHEYAHAWAANRLGDSTARYMGRLTMDPLAHISWFGTVLFPALAILTGVPIFFGWANPVPVDMRNFKKPRLHMAIVAAAGPFSNLVIATLSTAVLALIVKNGDSPLLSPTGPFSAFVKPAVDMIVINIHLNLFLAIFNLLPLPPLDGSRIVQGFVKSSTAEAIDKFGPQAQMLLLILFFTGAMGVLATPVRMVLSLLLRLFGIPLG